MNAVSIIGVVTVFGLVFLWLLALCAEKGVRPLGRVRQRFRRLPGWKKAFILIFVSVWIAFAGTKDGTNGVDQVEGDTNTVTQVEGGTNDWINIEGTNIVGQIGGEGTNTVGQTDGDAGTNGMGLVSGPLMLGRFGRPNLVQWMPTTITSNDIAQMWRVGATVDGNAFAAATENAVTNMDWRDYGGMSDSLRIKPYGWRFPFGNGTATGVTVFENGDFRPNVKTHFFPQPFDANLSLLPRWNWGLLPDNGQSVFWHEQTPSNSLVLTWHNALYNRDVNCPTNFQAELFADGRFDYRYPDRTVRHVPVFPFDWDGDGLENSVDPEPLAAGPDAHGTSAEWYGMVCSSIFTKFEQPNSLPVLLPTGESVYFKPDVNTNAYYFVNVVAESLASVYIMADGVSNLGNPVVVARAGETNQVPLLIGADYCISSSVPIVVSAPVNVLVEETFEHDSAMGMWHPTTHVKWPVPVSMVADSDGVVTPSVPEDLQLRLGGSFSWTGGCCVRHVGDAMQFCCDGCGCGGCTAYVNYLYEGYLLATQGPSCGCSSEHEGAPHVETDAGGGVSLGFDRKAVIFEDAYDNSPSNHVARRSTQTILTLRANGGINGGTLAVTTRNLSRLNLVDGSRPTGTRTLAPYEAYEVVSTNEGMRASTNLRDVEVEVTFTENVTGERMSVHDALTSVRLELHEVYEAPENKTCKNRHVYGVGEKVVFKVLPRFEGVKFTTRKLDSGDTWSGYELFEGDDEVDGGADRVYTCPIASNYNPPIRVSMDDVEYTPIISLVEPGYVFAAKAEWGYVDETHTVKCWPTGRVGEACLRTTLYVGPMHVSFQGIAASELPCDASDAIPPTGHFTTMTSALFHGRLQGAGRAHHIKEGNYWMVDSAGSLQPEPEAWSSGTLVWKIPIGWHRKNEKLTWQVVLAPDHEEYSIETSRPLLIGGRRDVYLQEREIFPNGTFRTDKYGHWISRSIDCQVILDGDVIQERHK